MTRRMIAAMLLASTLSTPLFAQATGMFRRGDAPDAQSDHRDGDGRHDGSDRRGSDRGHDGEQARPGGFRGGQPGMMPPDRSNALARPQDRPPPPPSDQARRFDPRAGGPGSEERPGDFGGRSPYAQRSPFDHPPGARHDGPGGNPGAPGWEGAARPDRRPDPGHRPGDHDWRDGRGRPDWRDGSDRRQDWRDRSDWNDRRDGYGYGWDGGYSGDRERRWNNGWRADRRYDWRGWRAGHRDVFRGPRYYAPRGWTYRRLVPGYRIAPYLFAEQYWIDDPWAYRLPPADGPYRWVRYYDDVLLIDLRSGLVVDAIPNLFY